MSVIVESHPDTKLSITRLLDASPEHAFSAWIDPEQMAKWMGPRAMIARADILESNPRVGGTYRVRMVKHDAKLPSATVAGVYKEITPHSKLVFTWVWDKFANCGQAEGAAADAAMGAGIETLVTVTFRPLGKKTEMTLLHENFPSADRRDSHNQGWSASVDQLAALFANRASE